ncbi:MAG: C25 family cysteine peptidase [Bacteroidales bacterium]|nr:C25 family cysteine peptidase [Bacteroidales bacterium]
MKRFTMQLLATMLLVTGLFFGLHAQAQRLAIDFDRQAPEVQVGTDNMNQLDATFTLKGLNSLNVETDGGTFSELYIPGAYAVGTLGTPKLPAFKKLIEIPFGADVSVKVKSFAVTEYQLADYGLANPIMPVQPSLRKDQEASDVPFEFDAKVYQNDAFISPELATVEVLGVLRGYRIARVTVAPVNYNPVKGIIRVYNDIEVEVTFDNVDQALTEYVKASTYSPYFDVVHQSLINTLGGGGYPAHPDLTKYPVKYLIVAPRMFENELQTFIEWKTMKGFEVITAYTDVIGTSYSAIQTWIHAQYNAGTPTDPAPSFVLLVGDTPQLPSNMGSSSGKMTDLYYASVDGDYFPEMYYGRFSATTSAQLLTQIAKTLYYEKYEFTDPGYLNDVTLIAGADGTWNPRVGQPTVKYGTINYFNAAHGFVNVNDYLTSPYSGCYSPEKIAVSMINYSAHCGQTSWGDPSLSQSAVNAFVNNGKYPVAVGNCCLAADFGYAECIGETWQRGVNKGSVAYIGSSPSSYWFEDFYWSVGAFPLQGNNNGYVPTFAETTWGSYDAPFNGDYVTTGGTVLVGNLAVTEVHIQNYPSHSSPLYYWQAYNVLGDPSLVPFYTEGTNNNVSHMAILPIGLPSYEVTAEPGSYVGISKDGVLHGSALVGPTGIVQVPLTPVLSGGSVDIVVTKPQFKPYMAQVPAAALEGPYVVFDNLIINDPTGNNNGQLDYGESVTLNTTLKNVGVAAANNVAVTMTTTDPFITITNGSALFGNIAAGATKTVNNAFAIQAAENIPDGHNVSLKLTATDGTEVWESYATVLAHAPNLKFSSYVINDAGGNNNGFLDPGETASMVVTIQNAGSSNASAVMAQLTSTDLYVSVLTSAPQAIGTLAPGITGTATFTVHAAANTPFGHTAELTLNMTAAMGISQQDVLLIEFSDYCEASTTYQDEFISKVVCGDINNSSGWQNAVANYTDITTTLEPGVPVPITITNGNAWSSDKVTVWIDWNLDKDLGNNPNETFVLTSNGGGATFTGNIVAPAGQQSGQYRMRIRMTYSSDPQPCGNSNYGEVEDYTILIGAPMYLEPPQNVSCSVTGSNVSLSWEAPLPMASSVSGYRIYMDDEMVAAVETGLTYVHNNCPAGSHWFSVSAVYPEGESEIAQPVHVEVGNIQGKLQGFIRDAATNLVINDAWVTTVNGDYGAVSYSTPFGSHYTLHLMGGTYNVICNAQGYTSATHNGITLENGGTTTVNFYLMPTDSYGEGTTTGIGKYDTEDLSIYPNPASTVLNISITGAASSARYTLLNYQGSTVYTHEIGELSGFAVQQLDISEYAAGIYYLRLETDQNVTIRKVVIK